MIRLTAVREARCEACGLVERGYDFLYEPSGFAQFRCLRCLMARLTDCLLAVRAVQSDGR